jgi:hypothetical protein
MLLEAIKGRQPVRNLMIEEDPTVSGASPAPRRSGSVDG